MVILDAIAPFPGAREAVVANLLKLREEKGVDC
jgi:hypothetical protein